MCRYVIAWTAMALAPFSSVAAQEPTDEREAYYALGQRFAGCGAHWSFAAEVAASNGLTDAQQAFTDMERGWSVAGMIVLVEGLHPSRQIEVETLFETMKDIRVDQLRAEREVALASGDDAYDAQAGERFQSECDTLLELQQGIVRDLRSGPELSELD